MTTDGRIKTPSSDSKAPKKAPTDPPMVAEAPTPEEIKVAKEKDESS
jgi:hypothetical protein